MPPRSHHLSAREFLFSPHAVQRLRERVRAHDLDILSDDALEDELDRRLARLARTGVRFRDAEGLGLAVEVGGIGAAPFTLILRGDARGRLRLVSTVIGRPLFGLLEFWHQEEPPAHQILSPEYGEPRLLRWEDGEGQHLAEVPIFIAQKEIGHLLALGVPITSISLWRPDRITLSVGVAKSK